MFDWSAAGLNCTQPTTSGDVVTIQGFNCVFKIVLNLVVQFAGIAVFILLLVGGFKYLTSGGNPEAKKAASGTITFAVIGLSLLLGSWLILLLIKEITGVDVTTFVIPGP
jgi:TRAP-type C4-dicarboxylate transport system permease small subunit